MRQFFLLVPLLLLLGCSGETKVVTHHSNGMIESKGYLDSDGFKTGFWTTWISSGNKLSEARYKNGVREGLETRWWKSGKKYSELVWKNGNKEGLETRWSENGEKYSELVWKNGKRIKREDK
jgi:antitoxin component YwqK of YwqJK toxin-antitoxin module